MTCPKPSFFAVVALVNAVALGLIIELGLVVRCESSVLPTAASDVATVPFAGLDFGCLDRLPIGLPLRER